MAKLTLTAEEKSVIVSKQYGLLARMAVVALRTGQVRNENLVDYLAKRAWRETGGGEWGLVAEDNVRVQAEKAADWMDDSPKDFPATPKQSHACVVYYRLLVGLAKVGLAKRNRTLSGGKVRYQNRPTHFMRDRLVQRAVRERGHDVGAVVHVSAMAMGL